MAYIDRRDLDLTLAGDALSGSVRDYLALLKPRVMSLVVFTALVGMAIAPGGIHPGIGLLSLFAIAVGAGAAGGRVMWWCAGIDAVMRRTSWRPMPCGRLPAGATFALGAPVACGSSA